MHKADHHENAPKNSPTSNSLPPPPPKKKEKKNWLVISCLSDRIKGKGWIDTATFINSLNYQLFMYFTYTNRIAGHTNIVAAHQTPADISDQIGNGQFIDKKRTFYHPVSSI